MIQIGPEPTGLVVRRADIFAWLPGLTRDRWKKIHHTFRKIYVPGGEVPAYAGQQPHYSKSEIKTKLVEPLLEQPKPASQPSALSPSPIENRPSKI